MRSIVAASLVIVAILHLLPLSGLLGSTQLTALYGIPFDEPNLLILMRHRAVLFGLLGTFLGVAAFRREWQPAAFIAGGVSVISFLALAWSQEDHNAELARVVLADRIALVCLALGAAALRQSGAGKTMGRAPIALLFAGLLPATALGHGTSLEQEPVPHDFRTDEAAYRSVRPLPALQLPREVSALYEDFPMDPEFLRVKSSELSGSLPVVIRGKSELIPERRSESGKALARDFLDQEYRALGFATRIQHYNFGNNFIAEKPGNDPSKVLLLTSHLDSVQCPGADDDGTGTISALSVARALAARGFRHTLRIIAFDQEEPGLIGSFRYVESLQPQERSSILGVLNLEMTAYNGKKDGAFHVIDCERSDSVFLAQALREAIAALKLPLSPIAACTRRSDHARFWQAEIPALMVIQNFFGGDANPCYHKACDTVDGLDFDYMATLTRAVASATARLLEPTSTPPNPQ